MILGSILFLLTSQPTHAQSTPERRLRISPLRSELVIEPGQAIKGSFSLKNTGSTMLRVNLSAEEFTVTNDQYDYAFQPKSPINKWVNFAENNITIDADQTYTADYLISVPIGAEPGGKYFSLFASALPTVNNGITSVDRVGSLVYLTVPGAITKTGELVSLNSPIISTGAIRWSASIRNSGSAHFRSQHDATVTTLWNTDVSTSTSSKLILPASIRLLQGTIDSPKWLGIYKIYYNFELGDNPSTQQSRYIVYLPLAQSFLALGIMLLFITLIIGASRRRKKLVRLRNRSIDKA